MPITKAGFTALSALLIVAPGYAQSAKDVEKAAENMATSPLKDANIMQEDIPSLLVQASAAPYAMGGLKTCKQFSAAISQLDGVLGPDVDVVKAKEGQSVGEVALDGVQTVASSLIPGRGIIRKITGADAHDEKVRAAYYSGGLRRAYLKGTARAKGCKI